MSPRSTRFLLLVLCAIPALGFDLRTHARGTIASFYFACPEFHIPPRVHAKAFTKDAFPSRTATWHVREFVPGKTPSQAYKVIGEVEVLQRGSSTTLWDLRMKAREAAEKMGGDALVDASWRDAGATKPKVGDRGFLVFTAKIARFDEGTTSSLVGK